MKILFMKNNFKKILISILMFLGILFIVIYKFQIESVINFGNCFKSENLCIYFIDVGQGDATLIKLPDNKYVLIDCGNIDENSKRKFRNFLEDNVFKDNEKVIDYFILTHSDNDHCGSGEYVFNNFQVKNFYRPNQYLSETFDGVDDLKHRKDYNNENLVNCKDNIAYAKTIVASTKEENLSIIYNKAGLEIKNIFFNYELEFLSPLNKFYEDSNDYSPIIKLTHKGKKIIFTGDASNKVESEILIQNKDLKVDVLKTGHHGSKNSSSDRFLFATLPKYVIISCGKNNAYGHPSSQLISRLKIICDLKEDDIYRTDYLGTIFVSINADGELNISSQMSSLKCYIKVEYLICMLVVLFLLMSYSSSKKEKKYEN